MRNVIALLFIVVLLESCKEKKEGKTIEVSQTLFLDSLKSICQINTIDTFDITVLQTDNFEKMIPISEELFYTIYSLEEDYFENLVFIQSYLPSNKEDCLSLIVYEKNYEEENNRVDFIDLINMDSKGTLLDKMRLAAKDNAVITYEVLSFLNDDTLKIITKRSSEPYFDPNLDTLYIQKATFKLNGIKRIDTLEIKKEFEVRMY